MQTLPDDDTNWSQVRILVDYNLCDDHKVTHCDRYTQIKNDILNECRQASLQDSTLQINQLIKIGRELSY